MLKSKKRRIHLPRIARGTSPWKGLIILLNYRCYLKSPSPAPQRIPRTPSLNRHSARPSTPLIFHPMPTIPIAITAHNGFYNVFPSFPTAPIAYLFLCSIIITRSAPFFMRRIQPTLSLTMLTIHPARHHTLLDTQDTFI